MICCPALYIHMKYTEQYTQLFKNEGLSNLLEKAQFLCRDDTKYMSVKDNYRGDLFPIANTVSMVMYVPSPSKYGLYLLVSWEKVFWGLLWQRTDCYPRIIILPLLLWTYLLVGRRSFLCVARFACIPDSQYPPLFEIMSLFVSDWNGCPCPSSFSQFTGR